MNEGQIKITKDNNIITVPNTICYHVAHAFVIKVGAILWVVNTQHFNTHSNLKVYTYGFNCAEVFRKTYTDGVEIVFTEDGHTTSAIISVNEIDHRYHWI